MLLNDRECAHGTEKASGGSGWEFVQPWIDSLHGDAVIISETPFCVESACSEMPLDVTKATRPGVYPASHPMSPGKGSR